MGSGFTATRQLLCPGKDVTDELDRVFKTPGSPGFQTARANNTFGNVHNGPGNWKDLLIAYLMAGVNVGHAWPAWCHYLEQLGTRPGGHLDIYNIAQQRFAALNNNSGVSTQTHPLSAGNALAIAPGSIDAPCPPT
jgi:hypothetical protein